MPHSVSPEPVPPSEDVELPDAPAAPTDDEPLQVTGEMQMGSSQTHASDAASEPPQRDSALVDMFDDDESDSDLVTSSAQKASQDFVKPSQSAKFSDPEVMKAFYQRLFPFRYLFQWLNHSATPTNDFAHREFAFTLPGDIYLRYQSFASADLMRKQCVAMNPSRFEIGPVYSTNPRDRKTLRRAAAFRPLTKELCFDIDMTDYDEIRTCCTGANICHRCWGFMTMAIQVLDEALREDFGFRHILWVYSGRRGVHAWVCDKRAREMDDAKRRAIAGYFELLKGGDSSGKKVNVKRPLHPHIERSLHTLRTHFQTAILSEQDPWLDASKSEQLLSLLPDTGLRASLSKKWTAAPGRSSASKWADIDALASSGGASATLTGKALLEAKQDILLEYCYPRLDAEVSKKLNHLLKSPFCVHPGTGRVCVPIRAERAAEFDPLAVPTVVQLLGEVDAWSADAADAADAADRPLLDWEKTSLKPYVEYFRGFVAQLLKDERGGKRGLDNAGDKMEF